MAIHLQIRIFRKVVKMWESHAIGRCGFHESVKTDITSFEEEHFT